MDWKETSTAMTWSFYLENILAFKNATVFLIPLSEKEDTLHRRIFPRSD